MTSLCLDVGNVLGPVRFDEFVTTVSVATNLPEAETKDRINLYQGMHDTGLISMKQILIKEFGIKSEFLRMQIMSEWLEVVKLDPTVISFFEEIVCDNKLALLSNLGYEHITVLESDIKFLNSKVFSSAIKYYSSQVGARKPSKLYYLSFLQMHPEFNGAVYVDDNEDNLEASKEFGFIPVRLDLLNMDKQEVEDKLQIIKMLVTID